MKPIDSFKKRYRFLSNFYRPCVIIYEGLVYCSVEHAFQAAKTLDFEDRMEIALLHSPSEAKQRGRTVELRNDWEDIKRDIMLEILRLKFQNKGLGERLVATYPRPLIEGNTWGDTYWGQVNGTGQNWLGKLLMQVRRELRANGSSDQVS